MKNRLAIDSVHWGRYFERHYIPIVNSFCDFLSKKYCLPLIMYQRKQTKLLKKYTIMVLRILLLVPMKTITTKIFYQT